MRRATATSAPPPPHCRRPSARRAASTTQPRLQRKAPWCVVAGDRGPSAAATLPNGPRYEPGGGQLRAARLPGLQPEPFRSQRSAAAATEPSRALRRGPESTYILACGRECGGLLLGLGLLGLRRALLTLLLLLLGRVCAPGQRGRPAGVSVAFQVASVSAIHVQVCAYAAICMLGRSHSRWASVPGYASAPANGEHTRVGLAPMIGLQHRRRRGRQIVVVRFYACVRRNDML